VEDGATIDTTKKVCVEFTDCKFSKSLAIPIGDSTERITDIPSGLGTMPTRRSKISGQCFDGITLEGVSCLQSYFFG